MVYFMAQRELASRKHPLVKDDDHGQKDKIMAALSQKHQAGTLSADERTRLKLFVKCFQRLSLDPKYPGLKTHEISKLSQKYGMRVRQSYPQNNSPSAGRVFWIYGPGKSQITVCGIEPHPDGGQYGRNEH